MSKITITVEGRSGTGKTAVIQHIAGHLHAAGFHVILNSGPARKIDDQQLVMDSLRADGLDIVINEVGSK